MRCFFLSVLVFACVVLSAQQKNLTISHGGIVRGDSTKKELALVFTADETAEGLPHIRQTLKAENVKAGFFFTGRFYRNAFFENEIRLLKKDSNYLGPHSDQHLLYCDWNKRDSLLVTRDSFEKDMVKTFAAMEAKGLNISKPQLFIPPFEWWNDSISAWSRTIGLQLINFTPGIRTNADYTWPQMGSAYKSSEWIMNWLKETVVTNPQKLQGAIILIHAGTDDRRKDKFYDRLKELIDYLKSSGFHFERIDDLLLKQ